MKQAITKAVVAVSASLAFSVGIVRAHCEGGHEGSGSSGKKGGSSGPGSGSFYHGLGEEHMFKPKPKPKPPCPDDEHKYATGEQPKIPYDGKSGKPYGAGKGEEKKPYNPLAQKADYKPYTSPGLVPVSGPSTLAQGAYPPLPRADGSSGPGYETPVGSQPGDDTPTALFVLHRYDPKAPDADQYPQAAAEFHIMDFEAPETIYEGEDLVVDLYVRDRGTGYPVVESVTEQRTGGNGIRIAAVFLRRHQGSGGSQDYRAVAEHRVTGLAVGTYTLTVNLGSSGDKTQTVVVRPKPANSLGRPEDY